MGGDRGPEEVVAGALAAAADGIVPVLFGPASLDARGLELVAAEQVIAMDDKPAEAVRGKPDSSLVAACRAVGEGRADAVVSAGNTGAMLAAGLLEIRRLPGVMRPAIAVADPGPRRPVGADRLRRERRCAAGAPAPVRPHGLDLRRGDPRDRQSRSAAAVDRRGAGEGQPARARGSRPARRERPELLGEHREPRAAREGRRRRRRRRLHRQHRVEAARGDDPDGVRRAPRGDHARRRSASSAGC